jgi:hypothetical protein
MHTTVKFIFATLFSLLLIVPVNAGLRQPDGTPLHRFGFASGPEISTAAEWIKQAENLKRVVPYGGITRTGLSWYPNRTTTPDFITWGNEVLMPHVSRGLTVLPGIKTLGGNPYLYPTDAQWTEGLRWIVRMYAPNGIWQKGGYYMVNGNRRNITAHPTFTGLTDFELWNEPNSKGNLGGKMTPAMIVHLLKIGSAAMREEAAKLGTTINIVGPAIGEINLDYLKAMHTADKNLFSYIDTVTFHDYMRENPDTCKAGSTRCVKTYALIRQFLDANGGAHVHIGTTEGGFAGSLDACRPPNVLTEALQSSYSEKVINWLRANPQLDFDFRVTYKLQDGSVKFVGTCGKTWDPDYWISKLGVIRSDNTLKAWGSRLNQLNILWK